MLPIEFSIKKWFHLFPGGSGRTTLDDVRLRDETSHMAFNCFNENSRETHVSLTCVVLDRLMNAFASRRGERTDVFSTYTPDSEITERFQYDFYLINL